MESFIKKNWLRALGVVLGALSGYLYYYFVGCSSGSCPITSSSWRIVVVGAIMGYLIFDIFTSNHKKDKS